jgi:SAM-dependent methyltransferase
MEGLEAHLEVPLGVSLVTDAPGYDGLGPGELGPLCWKCNAPKRAHLASTPGSVQIGQDGDGKQVRKTCGVCNGAGRLPPTRKRRKQMSAPAVPPLAKRPAGWSSAGPPPATPLAVTAQSMRADEQLVSLVGDWRILQRRAGHRWTTDDLVTAWAAVRAARAAAPGPPRRCLDLGTGNGTVLLMVAHTFPRARCVGVEARAEALELAARSIAHNLGPYPPVDVDAADAAGTPAAGLSAARVRVLRLDMRDESGLDALLEAEAASEGSAEGGRGFDLVTGTPPYWLVTTTTTTDAEGAADEGGAAADEAARAHAVAAAPSASAPSVPAAAAAAAAVAPAVRLSTFAREGVMTSSREDAPARCCFRGTVAAYCVAAARCLSAAAHARFSVCESAVHDGRVVSAAHAARLLIVGRVSVYGRTGKPALFRVWTMRRADAAELDAQAAALRPARAPEVSAQARELAHEAAAGYGGRPFAWVEEAITVRDAAGAWTARYAEVLEEMGICTQRSEPGAGHADEAGPDAPEGGGVPSAAPRLGAPAMDATTDATPVAAPAVMC